MFLHVHIDHSSNFIDVHFPARARCTSAELSAGPWSLGFFKICSMFLGGSNGSDIVFVQNPADSICCSIYVWKNKETFFV